MSGETVSLEIESPLSQSKLWQYQKDYFQELGIRAWIGKVPFYVTSNVYVANQYAQIIISYISDGLKNKTLSKSKPLYIIELGTGSGKFSFLFLNQIKEMQQNLGLEEIKICYVMTDFTESNVDFWKVHPQFQPYFEDGSLDVALFDGFEPTDIHLQVQNITLSKNSSKNPVVVVANYLFDSIPHDIFKIDNDHIYEGLLSTETEKNNIDENGQIKQLNLLSTDFTYVTTTTDHYDDPSINKVLKLYKDRFKQATFTIPIGAIKALNFLKTLSKQGCACLAGDKGYTHDRPFPNLQHTHIAFHGSFSLMVNFHGLSHYIQYNKGDSMLCEEVRGLKTCFFLTKGHMKDYPQTQNSYQQTINACTTEDFLSLKNVHLNHVDSLVLNDILSVLRLSKWDPTLFINFIEPIMNNIESLTLQQENALRQGMDRAFKHAFQLPASQDPFFEIGRVYYYINELHKALEAYKLSLKLTNNHDGPHYYNIGLCYYYTDNKEKALESFEEGIKVEPSFNKSKEWITLIKKELNRH